MSVHVELAETLRVGASPAEAFRFFTPEGERLYVPGWEPEYLHPADGAIVEGLLFRTRHGGEETLWLVSRCEPGSAVDYIRVTPGSRMGVVSVRLEEAGDGTSLVTVAYRLTALSPAGEMQLDAFARSFGESIASWERSIAALLGAAR